MRTKIIAALLAVLTALGGLNLFKSIKDRITQPATAQTAESYAYTESTAGVKAEKSSKIRVRVKARADVKADQKVRVRSTTASKVMIDERFDVENGETLVVDVSHADLEIETGNVSEAHVRVTLDSNDMDAATERFDEMNFRVEKSGSEVSVLADSPRGNWNFRGKFDLNVYVTIPEQFNAELVTSHGDVELGDLSGFVNLQTSHGDVSAGTIEGSEIALKSTHGDIEAERLISSDIAVNTSHADIEIEEVLSERFAAKTSHSDVTIERLSGASDITTSHGDIEIALADDFGAELKTTHGDVLVYAPADMKADLDLEGAQVRVSSGFDVSGSVKKDRVKGSVNAGGSRIHARTTHGSIELKKN